jgi:HD-like signal output (HDOD) protein
MGIQVFAEYQGSSNISASVDVVWKHSLQVSSLAFSIARSLGLSSQEREDARVSGVLHDVGMLLGFQIPGFFQSVRFHKNGHAFIESEYQSLGTSHAEMGGYLLGIWGLPNTIVEAVTFHHRPGIQAAAKPGLVTALHAANGLINACQIERNNNYAPYLDMPYLQKLGLVEHLDEWGIVASDLLNSTK